MPHPPQASPLETAYDAVIVGAGLAGSSLAAHLAGRGFSVFLAEAQRLPAHKLCGEFLSTEASTLFQRLGVLEKVQQAGAQPIRRTRLTASGGAHLELALPGTALGLTRYRLDHILWNHAKACGATARDGCSVRDVRREGDGYTVEIPDGTVRARLVVGAWGKRSRMDGRLARPFLQEQSGLVAFKAHYAGADLEDWIEMHAFPGGYCGLSPVEGGLVNACWIGTRAALQAGGGTPDGMAEKVLAQNPALAERLSRLHRVSPRFQAVAQVSFQKKGLFDGGVVMMGDAAAMITPFCGDGMSMALATAEHAATLVTEFLQGRMSREAFWRAYAAQWHRQFRRRLWLGKALHQAAVQPAAAGAALRIGAAVPALARWVVQNTRG